MHKWGHCHQLMNKGCMWGTACPPRVPAELWGLKRGQEPQPHCKAAVCTPAWQPQGSLPQFPHWLRAGIGCHPFCWLPHPTLGLAAGVVPSAGRGWQGLFCARDTEDGSGFLLFLLCCMQPQSSGTVQHHSNAPWHSAAPWHGNAPCLSFPRSPLPSPYLRSQWVTKELPGPSLHCLISQMKSILLHYSQIQVSNITKAAGEPWEG